MWGSVSGCFVIVYLGLNNRGMAKITRIAVKYKVPAAPYSGGTSEAGSQNRMTGCFVYPRSQLPSRSDFQFVAFGRLHMNVFVWVGQPFRDSWRIARDLGWTSHLEADSDLVCQAGAWALGFVRVVHLHVISISLLTPIIGASSFSVLYCRYSQGVQSVDPSVGGEGYVIRKFPRIDRNLNQPDWPKNRQVTRENSFSWPPRTAKTPWAGRSNVLHVDFASLTNT